MMHPALSTLLDRLNHAQRLAALSPCDRHLVVHAGAGTGKTQAIVARIAALQLHYLLGPGSIHAVTFSRAGRAELGTRLGKVAEASDGTIEAVLTLTLHGFAHMVLRGAVGLPGVWWSKRFDVVGTVLVERGRDYKAPLNRLFAEYGGRLLEGVRDDLPASERTWVYAAAIDRLRQGYADWPLVMQAGDLPPNRYLQFRDAAGRVLHVATSSVRQVMERYEQMLRVRRAHDYAGMVTQAVNTLNVHPHYLADIQRTLRHLVVDEFQDTSRAQENLLRLIAGKQIAMSVVGDSDQTIYTFNGSHIGNLVGFAERSLREQGLPATVIALEENYRSTQPVLEVANSVIARNPGARRFRLRQAAIDKSDPLSRQRASACPVTLVRAGSLMDASTWVAEEAHRLTTEEGINPDEIAVLVRKNSPRYPEADLVRAALVRSGVAVDEGAASGINWQHGQEAALWLCAQHRELSLDELRAQLRSGEFDDQLGSASQADVDAVVQELERAGVATAEAAAETLYAAEPFDTVPPAGGGVRVTTVHGAKGLEFRIVFVLYLSAGEFPHGGSRDEELDEERRLLYVAITRARERLYLLGQPHNRMVDFYREVDLEGVRVVTAKQVAATPPPRGPDIDQMALVGLAEWADQVARLKALFDQQALVEQLAHDDYDDDDDEDIVAAPSFFLRRREMADRADALCDSDEEDDE